MNAVRGRRRTAAKCDHPYQQPFDFLSSSNKLSTAPLGAKLDQRETRQVDGSHSETGGIFGWELNLDLYYCNPAKVRSREDILAFVIQLSDEVLDMKRFGEPWAERFGLDRAETAGYSVVQLIETSSIVGHFSELKNAVYLDIFSCKPFDRQVVGEFCRHYFEAERVIERFIERR